MSTYSIPFVNGTKPVISDLGFFADIMYDVNDVAPNYIGLHINNGASQDDANWKIYKFTYSSGAVTRIQLAYGSWTERVSLF
jgi:hypothetical protein